ncbi:LuxR C-terminal-related transcriptional regulator (plasmid) [Klebsiella pasteurii]|uniref:LuxR C-terminal-related transcriptional regulator n=1 Tax=Klebsiella pasteurii TaxID=2587529 RepID=UPI002543DDEC|nr:LuxR C-terminal-related transcriptional regulator [Klebsiella pasteurii]WII85147.1 LuxR C-terminal-related transcriptional regulator [Klebsiella pasteurii]
MFFFKTNFNCSLSKVTFTSALEFLNSDPETKQHNENDYIVFIDGNASDITKALKMVYDINKKSSRIYIITFLSEGSNCNSVIKQVSDVIIDKKVSYDILIDLIKVLISSKPKFEPDSIIEDIYYRIMTSYNKEKMIVDLLIEGYSQNKIADMLHMSIKTVSSYKMKAIKRFGVDNFNQLCMINFDKY